MWVEICFCYLPISTSYCHTLTGVWVEMSWRWARVTSCLCHTLTGVWVEIVRAFFTFAWMAVTPSRVCELKFLMPLLLLPILGHTLTGVWVEIFPLRYGLLSDTVTPSRVCELKLPGFSFIVHTIFQISLTIIFQQIMTIINIYKRHKIIHLRTSDKILR